MKNIFFWILLIILSSCTSTKQFTYDGLKEQKFKYKSIAEIRPSTGQLGSDLFAIATLGLGTVNRVGLEIAGYGNTLDEAKEDAINECKAYINRSPAHEYGRYNKYTCLTIVSHEIYKSKTTLTSELPKRNLENEYERYLKQCEQLGFKRNTEKIGECALKIKDIEAKIQISNSQTIASQSSQQQNTQITQNQNSSADTLANLVILNEALKLMNPPRQNFICQARPFGIYTNVYCN